MFDTTEKKKHRKYGGFGLARRQKHRYLWCFFVPMAFKNYQNTVNMMPLRVHNFWEICVHDGKNGGMFKILHHTLRAPTTSFKKVFPARPSSSPSWWTSTGTTAKLRGIPDGMVCAPTAWFLGFYQFYRLALTALDGEIGQFVSLPESHAAMKLLCF